MTKISSLSKLAKLTGEIKYSFCSLLARWPWGDNLF